jgi:hypothetical protein
LVDDGNGNLVPAYTIGGNLQNGNAFQIWDNTIEHGYYLMVLATEYELLSRDGQDLTAVKNELYYALNAINRIDRRAEPYLTDGNSVENLNGFFLRDDIPPSFLENFADEGFVYMKSDYSNAKLMEEYLPGSAYPPDAGSAFELVNACHESELESKRQRVLGIIKTTSDI